MISDTPDNDDFSPTGATGELTGTFGAAQTVPSGNTYAVNGAVAETNGVYTHKVDDGGLGVLYFNQTSGAYKFVFDDADVNALDVYDSLKQRYFVNIKAAGVQSHQQQLIFQFYGSDDQPVAVASSVVLTTGQNFTFTESDFKFTDLDANPGFFAVVVKSLPKFGKLMYFSTYELVQTVVDSDTEWAIGNLTIGPDFLFGLSYIPDDPTKVREDSFTFAVIDGSYSSPAVTMRLYGGAPPVVDPPGTIQLAYGEDKVLASASGTLTATDPDNQAVTFSATGAVTSTETGFSHQVAGTYGTLFLNAATGAYTYKPDTAATDLLARAVSEGFELFASDIGHVSAAAGIVFNVPAVPAGVTITNHAPVGSNVSISIVDTTADDTFNTVSGTFAATDKNNHALTFALTGATTSPLADYTHVLTKTHGKLHIHQTTGDYLYAPDDAAIESLVADPADEVFALTVSDGIATSNFTLTVDITGAHDRPVVVPYASFSMAEDTSYTFSAADFSYTLRDKTKTDTVTLSNLSVSPTFASIFNPLEFDATTFTLTPAADAYGGNYVWFDYRLNVNGVLSNWGSLTVHVSGVNDPPALGAITAIAFTDTAADDTFQKTSGTFSATDIDSSTLTYHVAGATASTQTGFTHEASGTYGVVYFNQTSGAYEFVPDDAAIESVKGEVSENFSVTASDGALSSAAQNLTVTVTGVTDTLDVSNAQVTVKPDEDHIFSLSDFNISERNGHTLSRIAVESLPDYGSLTAKGTTLAEISYISVDDLDMFKYHAPAALVHRDTSFSFRVYTTDPLASSLQATLTISVAPDNVPPVMDALTGISFTDTVDDDTFAAVSGTFTATDYDADTLTFSVTGAVSSDRAGFTHKVDGTYGQLHYNSGTGAYEFVPDDAAVEMVFPFAGNDVKTVSESYAVMAYDGEFHSTPAALNVTVTGVRDTVLANDVKIRLQPGEKHVFAAADFDITNRDGGTLSYIRLTSLPAEDWTIRTVHCPSLD